MLDNDASSRGADPGRVWYFLDSLHISFLLHNNNLNQYLWCEFRGGITAAGVVRMGYTLNAFQMDEMWSEFDSFGAAWIRLSFVIGVLIILLTCLRMNSELRAARKVRRRTGSYWPYWSSVFTVIEVINLICCWSFVALRIYTITIPERKNFDTNNAYAYRDMAHVAQISAFTMGVRGVSIITAAFSYFKYLALMPKTSTWYLTGTTLQRGGKDLKLTITMMAVFLAAWAVWAQNMFGTQSSNFQTWCAHTHERSHDRMS